MCWTCSVNLYDVKAKHIYKKLFIGVSSRRVFAITILYCFFSNLQLVRKKNTYATFYLISRLLVQRQVPQWNSLTWIYHFQQLNLQRHKIMKSSQSKITERHKNIWKTEATSISEKKTVYRTWQKAWGNSSSWMNSNNSNKVSKSLHHDSTSGNLLHELSPFSS